MNYAIVVLVQIYWPFVFCVFFWGGVILLTIFSCFTFVANIIVNFLNYISAIHIIDFVPLLVFYYVSIYLIFNRSLYNYIL